MQKHESSSDYIFRTALFIKTVYLYSYKLPEYSMLNVFKPFMTYGLTNYLHSDKVSTSMAFSLHDYVKAMLEEEGIKFNKNDFINVIELYNNKTPYDSFMFYPKLSNPRSLMDHHYIHAIYFKELAKAYENKDDINSEEIKDYLFASKIHLDGASTARSYRNDVDQKLIDFVIELNENLE